MKYIVIKAHRSEFPAPITFSKGDLLVIGEEYVGPENWNNWYFCKSPKQQEGWVPKQLIEWTGEGSGVALADYTAKELDVDENDILTAGQELNGWVWCSRQAQNDSGWVPIENLKSL